MRRRRRFSKTAAPFVALMAIPALCAGQSDGPTIRGRLAGPGPAAAVVELLPLLDPHARALVELGEAPAPAAVARVEAAADGGFALRAPGPGPWRLRVEVPGHMPHERVLAPGFDVVELEPVPVMPAEEPAVTVLGPAGEPLPGAVAAARPRLLELRDAAGRPLADAVVGFSPGPGERRRDPWPAGVTDERGRVRAALPAEAEAVAVETGRGWAVSLPLPPDCGVAETPCVLGLPAPLELAGEVRDAVSSRPLGGGLVWPHDQPDRVATADGRGRFVLRFAPGAAPERLAAAAAGHVGRETPLPHDQPSGPLLVALEPAMRVAGRVVDPEGAGLEAARIRLWPGPSSGRWPPEPEPWELVTTSGAGGGFELPAVAARPGPRLRAELAGYAPAELQPLAEAAEDLEIVLTPGGGVVGRLVDGAGEPVPGGRVRLLSVPESRGRSYDYSAGELVVDGGAQADADGRFAVPNLVAGRYELIADHPDHATRQLPPVEVAEGETVDLGTIELAPGGRLAGRVVDPDDRPVEGVSLEAVAANERSFGLSLLAARGSSGDDGGFELTGLPQDVPLRLHARPSGYPAVERDGIVLPLDAPLLVELRPGARVFGRVVGPDGEPLEGAQVQAQVLDSARGGSRSVGWGHAETGEDGGFEIEGLAAGALRLVARAEGYLAGEAEALAIGDHGDAGPIEIRLGAGAEVAGRVRAPDGSPAPGAEVWVHTGATPAQIGVDRPSLLAHPDQPVPHSSAGAESDARGEFVIRGAAPGPATVVAEHERLGDAAAELVVRPGVNSIELILDARNRIEGRVVDAGGAPVGGAGVTLTGAGAGRPSSQTRPTDFDGRFLFRWLRAGDYELQASAPGLRLEGTPPTVTVADAPVPLVELVLTPGEEIAGRVLRVPEAELPRIEVAAHVEGVRRSGRSTVPGPDGRFRLTGLGPGRWTVAARGPTGRSARGEVEVAAGGGPYRLDLDLGGGLTLTGSVQVDGEPLAGASVAIVAGGGVPRGAHVETGFDGTFRAEGLEPGDYEIWIAVGGSRLARRELTLTADDEIHLDLAAASLTGRVLDAGGAPVAGAGVMVMIAGRQDHEAMAGRVDTDTAGRFAFPHLAPGRYEVTAVVEGKPMPRAAVTLEAGDRREIELRAETGLELVLVPHLTGGGQPHLVNLLVLRGPSMPVYSKTSPVGADGTAVYPDVPAGVWTVLVYGRDTAVIDAVVEVPGPPVTVVLPPATVLEVEAPALDETAAVPLTIVGANGRPPAIVAMGMDARLFRTGTLIPQLPPGTWTVRAVAPDGRVFEGTATTTPERPARLVLD